MEEASETVIFGPSTANQIERWWKELHEKLEKFYNVVSVVFVKLCFAYKTTHTSHQNKINKSRSQLK